MQFACKQLLLSCWHFPPNDDSFRSGKTVPFSPPFCTVPPPAWRPWQRISETPHSSPPFCKVRGGRSFGKELRGGGEGKGEGRLRTIIMKKITFSCLSEMSAITEMLNANEVRHVKLPDLTVLGHPHTWIYWRIVYVEFPQTSFTNKI